MTAPLSPLPHEFSERLREQLRRLLLHFEVMRTEALPAAGSWVPPIDIYELDDAVIVRLELPGVSARTIRVKFLDGTLKIEGAKETSLPAGVTTDVEKPLRYLCLERTSGSFNRQLQLKWSIEVDRIDARLSNGILEIRLPKDKASSGEIQIPIIED